jgi:site-specific recombinase
MHFGVKHDRENHARQKPAHMITRDAKEYPKTVSSEIQGGRPLHFLRLLSRYPLLDYGTTHRIGY